MREQLDIIRTLTPTLMFSAYILIVAKASLTVYIAAGLASLIAYTQLRYKGLQHGEKVYT